MGLIASLSVYRFPVCKVGYSLSFVVVLCSCLDVSLFVCVVVVADNHKPNAELTPTIQVVLK